ncbi:hypothetical protein KOW79_007580 [Hemibagrus wyckioides]|uniref:Uncharacterized protein n=1 Tax=Hemibagrus wyckioides TaxID=337641 RepID=A0A9D3SLS7_9TELE|nr:hypothetical protein KOW79_007580 [Hemibagrus wyckioides]
MEDVGSDPEQDMGEGGRLSGSGATTEAEGATEERRTKRSRLERGREFDLLTAGDIIGTREIEVEGARAVHTLGEDCLQRDGGTREEEGWTQVVARRRIGAHGARDGKASVAGRLGGKVHSLGREVRGHSEPVPMRQSGTSIPVIQGQAPAREKGEEAVFTEGAAEPAASSGPVSEEVAGPSGKEVRLTQAEGGSSDLTPGESLTAGQVTPAVGAPSGEEQASWPGLGLEAGLFGIWAEATEGVAEASTLV